MGETQKVTKQILAVNERYQRPVIAMEHVPMANISRYGVIDAEDLGGGVYQIKGMWRSPSQEDAPSDLGIVGRYVITPDVFPIIDALSRAPVASSRSRTPSSRCWPKDLCMPAPSPASPLVT